MSSERVLVTGFEPFDDEVNASQALVESLRDDPPTLLDPLIGRLAFAILPVDTERIGDHVEALLADRPALWLMTGQDASRDRICVETRARNRRCFDGPDNAGRVVREEPILAGAAEEVAVTIADVADVVAGLRARGARAQLSDDAGAYLCNQALYLALAGAQGGRAGRTGFVHVPLLPEQAARRCSSEASSMPLDETREAVSYIILRLCR